MRTPIRIAAAAVLAAAALGVCAQGILKYDLDIVDPAYDASVLTDSGDVSVRVAVVPDLAQGDGVELLVDGQPAGAPAGALEFQLSGIAPGEHMLQARIIDSTGNVASVSQSRILYVWQPARTLPTRSDPR